MRLILWLALGLLLACAFPAATQPAKDLNDYGPPEYGHGLDAKDAAAGWISLFDGKTTFGWSGAKVENAVLVGGMTTTAFGPSELRAEIKEAGTLEAGGEQEAVERGRKSFKTTGRAAPIQLGKGASLTALVLRPLGLKPLFNGKDLTDWKRIDHPRLAKAKQPSWQVIDGAVNAVGGPGALEYQGGRFGDFILQIDVRTRARHANGGVFFRCQPGLFMMGYEAQVYNRCEKNDVSRPSTWATGAIDDRQNTRRLVSRDGDWFTMTVLARGPHIATWVNGYQTTDWTDTRKQHDNPRQGLRLEAGTLQLQAHDTGTDVEFRNIRIGEYR
jgi:hypothetical protein